MFTTFVFLMISLQTLVMVSHASTRDCPPHTRDLHDTCVLWQTQTSMLW